MASPPGDGADATGAGPMVSPSMAEPGGDSSAVQPEKHTDAEEPDIPHIGEGETGVPNNSHNEVNETEASGSGNILSELAGERLDQEANADAPVSEADITADDTHISQNEPQQETTGDLGVADTPAQHLEWLDTEPEQQAEKEEDDSDDELFVNNSYISMNDEVKEEPADSNLMDLSDAASRRIIGEA